MDSVKIIENGFVVTCDSADHAGYFAILVKGDRIVELNAGSAGLRARYPNAEIVDAAEKAIFPGFVDAHYHGESFALRTWTAGMVMSRWQKQPDIRGVFSYMYRDASKDELVPMYRAAYFTALKAGVTTLSEFGFDHLDIPLAAAREALKRSDLKGYVGIHNSEQMDYARADSTTGPRSTLVLAGEEDLTLYNLQTTIRLAGELKWPIVSHLGETRQGHETVRRNFNRSIPRILDEFRVLQHPVQLTHVGPLEETDLQILANLRIPVVVNPVSLFSKQTDHPPLAAFLAHDIPVALGSDWGVPDPFENMRQVSRLTGEGEIDPLQVVRMHTINGARALHMHEETGSIEAGKKADMTFVDIADSRHVLPVAFGDAVRFLRNVIQGSSSGSVSDVMINGEFFLRKGQIMTYAEEDLKREYREAMKGLLDTVKSGAQVGFAGGPGTPILRLRQESGIEDESRTGSESFDEGFRIIGTTGSLAQRSDDARPKEQQRDPSPQELPKTVRRTFGEDDF
ncbi:MAG: amidohydrolase family protein [Ignavibacteriales bacterium]|nr:amidohydrolase family protein [Ignavibacteriales bacterium]